MVVLVLFGPPGSGKGTQAKFISEKYNFKHISTGDLFRYNIGNKTELGLKVQSIIAEGNLVPDEITTEMLKDELKRSKKEKGIILDGYPRNVAQAEVLDTILKDIFKTEVAVTLALQVEDEVLVERITKRGLESGRADDADEEIVRNRVKVYYEETAPVGDFYKGQDKWSEIDGEEDIKKVTASIFKAIDKRVKKK